MRVRLNYLFVSVLFFCISLTTIHAQNKVSIIAPKGGVTIKNNMPIMVWKKIDCDYYEIWIDNIKVDSIGGHLNSYTPFPLSFGQHFWKIVAVTQNSKIESEKAAFSIYDQPLSSIPDGSILLRNNWKVISSEVHKDFGSALSSKETDTKSWATTSIPATVLTALVRNGYYPNPYIGLNNMRIPDSNDEYNKEYDLLKYSHIKGKNPWIKPYWFRTEFDINEIPSDKFVWLTFNEINYRAEVWLNGKQLADTSAMVGMERQFRFNINSSVKKGKNILAVLIYPLDYTGKPAIEPLKPFSDPGTNMADGMTGKNYSKWDVLGWDWQPAVRDRDMGITEDVFVSFTDAIELKDLYIATDLNLPDTSSAAIKIAFDLVNHSSKFYEGKLKASFELGPEIISFEEAFRLAPNETKSVFWNPADKKELLFKNPKLWWPVGYGNPNLYKFKLEASASNGINSGITSNVGIRELETYIGPKERVYKINGKEIYLRGGNWVIDMMLNWTAQRYEHEILLTRNANLNILRIWGPTGVPPKVFYDYADKYGMLLWQDFLNDYWGTFRNTPGFQPDINLFEKATIEVVKKYRNHPSLIIWCGGNEGVNPRESLITGQILPKYDPWSSRHYLKQSDGDGLHGGGPYRSHYPKEYYTHFKLNGFSSEIGSNGIPVFESIVKFMPELAKNFQEGRFPIDGVWAYHDANDWPDPNDSRKFTFFDNIIRDSYGAPMSNDIIGYKDYINKCQLVNYDINRASIEAINSQLWNNASGLILWKSNSSWPSMVWQVYDWYLQSHAGYYGTKIAGEPVHIQLHRINNTLSVWNSLYKDIDSAQCSAVLYDSKLQKIWNSEQYASLKANTITALSLQVPLGEELLFLKLAVKNKTGKILSENFYWLHTKEDYTGLEKLEETTLEVKSRIERTNEKFIFYITLKNTGKNLAFMNALALQGKDSEMEILPTYWSDNYFSLLPGESKTVKAEVFNSDIFEPIVVTCKAYNGKEIKVEVKK